MEQLPESQLITFIDEQQQYALYFLEGQKLISDLALIHHLQGPGFAYFRDIILSVEPMIALLKWNEWFGFYLDSEKPSFQFKLETNTNGFLRCLLLPENFNEFPTSFQGNCRIVKKAPKQKAPYQSIVEANGLSLEGMVNRILSESYQVNSVVQVSQDSDQSALLHQLPLLKKEEGDRSSDQFQQKLKSLKPKLYEVLLEKGLLSTEEITQEIQQFGFKKLNQLTIKFFCPCNKDQFIQNILSLPKESRDSLFEKDTSPLEVTCEYCKTQYQISQQELEEHHPTVN